MTRQHLDVNEADEQGEPDWVESFVRQHANADFTVEHGLVWIAVTPGGFVLPEHGWKLHISSRAADFRPLVKTLLPFLLAERCAFKLARSQRVLRELNDGLTAPASVGKAFTVYPDQRRVRDLGLHLARMLRGHAGPRILSDRRVSKGAPVYYRYGPFVTRRSPDARARHETRLTGPGGEEFEGLAGLSYRQPSWITDPFSADGARPDPHHGLLLGGRYRVTAGIRQAAQGNVYRATDTRDNAKVIVKQARAHVAEGGNQADARLRLRNERRILQALDGLPGVPRFTDHFRHGADEFLVTTDCGPRTLAQDVAEHGPYRHDGMPDERGLGRLGARLARILISLHERGVIMRDLSPSNVVVGDGVSVIDFGYAAYGGVFFSGMTPGYASARQVRDEPPTDADDLHQLGMTLLYAASGVHPVALDENRDLPRIRALQALSRRCGRDPTGIMAAIAGLLSGDDELVRASARQIAAENCGRLAAEIRPLPKPPAVTPELAAEIADNLASDLVRSLAAVLDVQAAHDVSVYSGSAGIGLELVHHAGSDPAAARLGDLVDFTMRGAGQLCTPGLFTGVTGVDIFLREAGSAGAAAESWPGRKLPPSGWDAELPDLLDGSTGVGIGHLYFWRAAGDPADLAIARQCALKIYPEREFDTHFGKADIVAGRAHGLAGVAELMLGYAEAAGSRPAREMAMHQVSRLASRARTLIRQAADPSAEPMALSWCRGLAGIGQTLLYASTVLDDGDLADLARAAADRCAASVSRLSKPGQCCGIAGVGNYLMNVAATDKTGRYQEAARDVAAHLLLRSAGTPAHPRYFAPGTAPHRSLSWSHGLAGILSFFRRLAHGGPEPIPALPAAWAVST